MHDFSLGQLLNIKKCLFLHNYLKSGDVFESNAKYICTIGCTSWATLKISARWLNITIYQIMCQRWFWEMLQFRRVLELFLLLQFQNHLWYRMVYIVIFNSLARIPYVALLVPPMVHLDRILYYNYYTA